jgi:2-haloacid dehalogenase
MLRDGIALAPAGAYADFRTVAFGVLRGLLAEVEVLGRDPEAAAEHVLKGFGELDVHRDAPEGVHRLADASVRIATLANSAAEIAEKLLERAGLADLVERFLSVDEVRRWKPARASPTCMRRASWASVRRSARRSPYIPGTSTEPSAPACRRAG